MEDFYLSVIIPTYNEEKRIQATLSSLRNYFNSKSYSVEVIVVDDGSNDGTVGVIRSFQSPDLKIQLITIPVNQGKGRAVHLGMMEAKGQYRVFMDADQSVKIDNLDSFLDKCNQGADVVIGSIAVPGAKMMDHNASYRQFLGAIAKVIIKVMVLPGINDTQRGFKLFRAEAVQKIFRRQTIWRFGFDIELLVIARTQKLITKELPVAWENASGSTVRVWDYFLTFFELTRIITNKAIGRYD